MKTSRSPEPIGSPLGSLIAQWREKRDNASRLIAKAQQQPEIGAAGYVATGEESAYHECADELEAALKPLADLEAELRRFAESQRIADELIAKLEQLMLNDPRPSTAANIRAITKSRRQLEAEQALAWAETLKGVRDGL